MPDPVDPSTPTHPPDPHGLQRFVDAQAGVHARVLGELRAARKRSHWMWFVFPQLRALGRSEMARRFGIGSLEEARAYAAHPLLGARLRECSACLLEAPAGLSALDILGPPDDLKLRSSMTLFAIAAPEDPCWQQVLDRYFEGRPDARTRSLLGLPDG